MKLFKLIAADPPWVHSDQLTMSKVKRGAKSQYESLMTTENLKGLEISRIVHDDALLALWVPGTHMQDGLDVMKAWGFSQKQIWVWVKIKKSPLDKLKKLFKAPYDKSAFNIAMTEFNINDILSFYMGHYFRQTHELCLIGVRGKLASKVTNHSQRSVFLGPIGNHSEKPEALQDMLELMFKSDDEEINKLELFARRDRKGWTCLGNECPSTFSEDIRESLSNLK